MHALGSLSQLLANQGDNTAVFYVMQSIPIDINDFPTYAYRGLIYDGYVSSLPCPCLLILQNLDVMSRNTS